MNTNSELLKYDKIVIGAGLYGLYSALFCGKKGQSVLVLEQEASPFTRATYINQARVHQGYHYPRSLSTAAKSAGYFQRFTEDYGFCVNQSFEKVYATSKNYSWTNKEQFKSFCNAVGIPCEELHPAAFFNDDMCDGAFLTREYTYDANILKDYFISEISSLNNVSVRYNSHIDNIEKTHDSYSIHLSDDTCFVTDFVINCTYASTNQILEMVGYEKFEIKYELCEIILCDAGNKLKNYGITVMDGPFFSIMPFGKTGLHSLTSVTFTPHCACYSSLPEFDCQNSSNGTCSKYGLSNCNSCSAKPSTAYAYMGNLARKYLKDEYEFNYKESLYSIKPILISSEIDDSRPTVIKTHSDKPTFISVLSGKINTVYDLDDLLI